MMPNEVDANGEASQESCKVSIKIPPFWPARPEVWFYQVEAQFKLNLITSEDTKFNYLVSQLEPKFVENIWDIVTSTSTTKYTESKTRLFSLFQESESLRMKRLITGIELGTMKPSQLLQKLRTVATADVSDNLLKTLWLEKLPESIRNILVVSEEDVNKLATMADKIADMSSRTEVCSNLASTSTPKSSPSVDELIQSIKSLEMQVASMRSERQGRSSVRNHFRKGSRSKSRKRYDPNGKLCFFHFRFGKKCLPEKCIQPCSWKQSENSSQQ